MKWWKDQCRRRWKKKIRTTQSEILGKRRICVKKCTRHVQRTWLNSLRIDMKEVQPWGKKDEGACCRAQHDTGENWHESAGLWAELSNWQREGKALSPEKQGVILVWPSRGQAKVVFHFSHCLLQWVGDVPDDDPFPQLESWETSCV